MAIFSKIATGLLAMAASSAALERVVAKGSNFVFENSGNRFDIIGVAYQPGGSAGYNPGSGIDPLSKGDQCLRDAAIMQKAGINTIRVYNLDPAINHDDCVSVFNAAGIYMILDVNSPLQGESINAAEPWTTYTKAYLTRVFQVIENFKNYDNLIGFFSGNEVINDMNSGKIDPPYIRAVTRDMKNYIAKQSPDRAIPVGYSAADVREILTDTNNYLQCTTTGDANDPSRIDFFGLNSYSWCGDATIASAGYDVLMKDFSASTVPVFFSEYGCNAVTPRPFTEVAAIYGAEMRNTFSGGIAYEYTQEANNYGLVTVNSDNTAKMMTDYDNLVKQLSALDMSALSIANTSATSAEPVKCDASLITNSGFNNNFTMPAIPDGVQDLIDNGVGSSVQGKMAAPSSTACPFAVQDSAGQPMPNMAIQVVQGSMDSSSDSSNSTNLKSFGTYKNVTLPIGTAVGSGSAAPMQTGNSTGSTGSGSSAGVTSAAPTYAANTMVPSASVPVGYGGAAASATTSSKGAAVSTGAAVKREIVGAGSLLAVGAAVAALL